jgi:hypothetical protein
VLHRAAADRLSAAGGVGRMRGPRVGPRYDRRVGVQQLCYPNYRNTLNQIKSTKTTILMRHCEALQNISKHCKSPLIIFAKNLSTTIIMKIF